MPQFSEDAACEALIACSENLEEAMDMLLTTLPAGKQKPKPVQEEVVVVEAPAPRVEVKAFGFWVFFGRFLVFGVVIGGDFFWVFFWEAFWFLRES